MRILIGSVIGVAIGYLIFSFTAWDINAANWRFEHRVMLSLVLWPVLAFIGAVIGDHWE
jgi:phosphate/sulfate permease